MVNNLFSNKDVILITGGLGYIGSNLLKRLNAFDCKVYVITSKTKNINVLKENYEIFTCDITDFEKLNGYVSKINPNYIFHLAANTSRDISIETIDSMVNVNMIGTLNLLKSCLTLAKLKSFVILGTSEEYGNNMTPFKENMKEDPISPYSLSKTCGYYICKMFYNLYKIPIVYLRPSLVFGQGQPETMFIPSVISTLARNKPFKMTLGEQTRNFIYIDDLIEYLLLASTSKECIGQIINIGNENIKIIDVARKIGQKMNKLHLIKPGAKEYRKNEIMKYEVDISKSIKLFRRKPKVNLDTGLDKIINSYENTLPF
jgi:UDP-glucose 4-epimerase